MAFPYSHSECLLNETGNYALILENTTDDKSYVCYSSEQYMDIGKKLVKLLHGEKIVSDTDTKAPDEKINKQIEVILKRARELNSMGKNWHHHMLFPGCMFNKKKEKFVIVFEDKEAKKILESVSDAEPRSELGRIETLFYAQKKAE